MKKAEKEIEAICSYMKDLSGVATKFSDAISKVNRVYMDHMDKLSNVVEVLKKTDWDTFTAEEKLITENTALLVNLFSTWEKFSSFWHPVMKRNLIK
jgi:phage-related tail protein